MAKQTIIIGGGAAGFFSAIQLAEKVPGAEISILEKSTKLLSKVKISGGGRCNVTHACLDDAELVRNYPRGNKELRQVFSRFSVKETIEWFHSRGVRLKTEEDGRMFPVSDSSQSIIDLFLTLCKKYRIRILTECEVTSIRYTNCFQLKTSKGEMKCDSLISAIGGHPKSGSYDILKHLGHHIIEPTPSLFTFNLPNENIRKELQGLSVQKAEVYLEGSKNHYIGPVLITHWGLSGPAVLKLSAFASKDLFEKNYKAVVIVNWAAELKMHEIQEELLKIKEERARQFPYTTPHFGIPKRLWEFFCEKAELSKDAKWSEVPKKNIHWLSEIVGRSTFQMEGKTTFKEEFVTCGGVDLKEVNLKTMESKKIKGLYFCGEVLDIDGVTGGFNFQNAWSTAWICADSIASRLLHIRSG